MDGVRPGPRARPQIPLEEAAANVREQFCGCVDGGFLLKVPGAIYGGREVLHQALEDALQPGNDLDVRFDETGATRVDLAAITDRCFSGHSLGHLCNWLARRPQPVGELNLDGNGHTDDDMRYHLIPFLQDHGLPGRLVLSQNCFTLEGALHLAEAMAQIIERSDGNQQHLLDLRWGGISDPIRFRELAELRLRDLPVQITYEDTSQLQQAETRAVKFFILLGPSWCLSQANLHIWDKEAWSRYMSGPSFKVGLQLDYAGATQWECPLCTKRWNISERGAHAECPGATFGGILASHFQGDQHRKKVQWKLHEPMPLVRLPHGVWFNVVTGAQGYSEEEAMLEAANFGVVPPLPQLTLPPAQHELAISPFLSGQAAPSYLAPAVRAPVPVPVVRWHQAAPSYLAPAARAPVPAPPGPPPISTSSIMPPGPPPDSMLPPAPMPPPGPPPYSGLPPAPQAPPLSRNWTIYVDPANRRRYWWQAATDRFFYEDNGLCSRDEQWVRYRVSESDCERWWWNNKTGEFFYESTGSTQTPDSVVIEV